MSKLFRGRKRSGRKWENTWKGRPWDPLENVSIRVEKSELHFGAFSGSTACDVSTPLSFQFKRLSGTKNRDWPLGGSEKVFEQKQANYRKMMNAEWLKRKLYCAFREISSHQLRQRSNFRHCITARLRHVVTLTVSSFCFLVLRLNVKTTSWSNTQPVWMCVLGSKKTSRKRFNFRFRFRAIAI